MGRGLTAIDHSLQLKPDYIEAIATRGCSSAPANLEKDPAKQQQLLKDADRAEREGERDA